MDEKIFIDKVYTYATPYTTLFEGPATFEVYQYNDKNELVRVGNPLSVENENGASTPELAPGTYYVKQVNAPENTDGLITDGTHGDYETINGVSYQKVVISEGQETPSTHELTFVNKVAQRGVLVVEKVDENGQPQNGVGFAVKQDDNTRSRVTTGENGQQTILLPKGEYTLVETDPPEGYASMQPKSFTIEENGGSTLPAQAVSSIIRTPAISPSPKSSPRGRGQHDGSRRCVHRDFGRDLYLQALSGHEQRSEQHHDRIHRRQPDHHRGKRLHRYGRRPPRGGFKRQSLLL